MPGKIVPRKPGGLYKCPFCGVGYTHDKAWTHVQYHCPAKRPTQRP